MRIQRKMQKILLDLKKNEAFKDRMIRNIRSLFEHEEEN